MSEHIYDAVILGAGYGGVGAAAQFKRQGIDNFMLLERANRVGGVWRDNSYPGAACDTQSHIYCYSYHLNYRVSALFAGRDEILSYIESLVNAFHLERKIRLNTEVIHALWDESRKIWRIEATDGRTYLTRVFVPSWGQLSTPSIPDFDGLDRFRGTWFHSARWNHGVDLRGKRVATIGSAASAVQYVPEVAKVAEELVVFQRSANYILPRGQVIFSDTELDAFSEDHSLFMDSRQEIHAMREASFVRMKHDSSAQHDAVREARTHLETQVADPELRQKLKPDYEYGCKRVLRSDDYYPALMRPNVKLETSGISQITESGVITNNGRVYECDAIILGTGFKSQSFQGDLEVVGRNGVSLAERWGDDPEAYLGMTIDGFPNMFLIYGPNTNLNHNSVVTMMEAQQEYIVRAIQHLDSDPDDVLEVDPSVLRRYNEMVQRELKDAAFSSACSSWYKNDAGKVINNWSGTVDEYRVLTASLRRDDYISTVQAVGVPSR